MRIGLRTRVVLAFSLLLGVLGMLGIASWNRNSATMSYLHKIATLSSGMLALDDVTFRTRDADSVAALRARRDRASEQLVVWNATIAGAARDTRAAALCIVGLSMLMGGLALIAILRELTARERTRLELACRSALLRDAHDELRDLYDNAPVGYHSLDSDGTIVRMNDSELRSLGYTREEVVGRMNIRDLIAPAMLAQFEAAYLDFLERNEVREVRTTYRRKDGSLVPVLVSATAVRDQDGRFVMTRTSATDITELTQTREELETLVSELEKAMASIRTLTGLLPMCSLCHRIRDDTGYWARIEAYVSKHTEAQVSHGVCPTCFPKLYPGIEMEPDEVMAD